MKKILFVGEHPLLATGNGGMMESLLSSIDTKKYSPVCFASEPNPVDPMMLAAKPFPFPIVSTQSNRYEAFTKLSSMLRRADFDAIVFVGMDIWEYCAVLKDVKDIIRPRGTALVGIFPYDIQDLRKDWVKWIEHFDYPCVYSKYGYDMLKDAVPRVRYFRPRLQGIEFWTKFSEGDRHKIRQHYFPFINKDTFLFGFVGANQIRKDPQLFIKAYSIVKKELPDRDIRMYLHSTINAHYNLKQYGLDCGLKTNDILTKQPNTHAALPKMVNVYNAIDCLVNCSLQEGLSWTLVEAMLCGTPFIASKTTAQIELLEEAGYPIPCEEPTYMPMFGSEGQTWLDAKRCKLNDLVEAMFNIAESDDLRRHLSEKGLAAGKKWLEGMSDINDLLDEVCTKPVEVQHVEEAVLFAQHSSAGDVLMSTQCFKGIKERHPNLPLLYMTQDIYANIVESNPYIDKVILWNEDNLKRKYKVVYNPHGEKILPGRFNTLDTKLYDMYPYFCKVKSDKIHINMDDTREDLMDQITGLNPYIVVHTTGGSPVRIYPHMDKALSGFKGYDIVQIGGEDDVTCNVATLDLRGKLTWRETAYVMWMAEAAVVIDSYPAHLAGAVDTPAVVLFGPAPARVTGPRSDNAPMICLEPNHLDVCPQMGFCYGDQICNSPCIRTINPMKIRIELNKLLKTEVQSKQEGV